jgi:hypothetical protein
MFRVLVPLPYFSRTNPKNSGYELRSYLRILLSDQGAVLGHTSEVQIASAKRAFESQRRDLYPVTRRDSLFLCTLIAPMNAN